MTEGYRVGARKHYFGETAKYEHSRTDIRLSITESFAVIKHLEAYPAHIPGELGSILPLDKGVIIHRWPWARHAEFDMDKPGTWKNYSIRSGKADRAAVVVAFPALPIFSGDADWKE